MHYNERAMANFNLEERTKNKIFKKTWAWRITALGIMGQGNLKEEKMK